MLSLRKVYVSFAVLTMGTTLASAASFYGLSRFTLGQPIGAGVTLVSQQHSLDKYADLGSSAIADFNGSAPQLVTQVQGSTLPSPTTAKAQAYWSLIFKNTNSVKTTLTMHYTFEYQLGAFAGADEYAEVSKSLNFNGSFMGGSGFLYTLSAPPSGTDSGVIEGDLTAAFLPGQSRGLQIDIANSGYAAVPEPASLAVFGIGLVGILARRRAR